MGSISPPPPQKRLHIAILECDTPLPQTRSRYPGYGNVFEALLRAGAKALGWHPEQDELVFTMHQVEIDPSPGNYPDLEEGVDVVLITGSRHDSFSSAPWIQTLVAFTQKILAQDRVRIIGVCFGHQIVARAMGVEVGRNADGWEAAVNDVQLTQKGREVFRVDCLWDLRSMMDGMANETMWTRQALHQMHRDVVYAYPQGVESLGSSPVCSVQGMYIPRRLITVQGHPEFNEEIMVEIIESRHALGIFDDKAYKTYIGKVTKAHDGLVVSQAFLRFLMEE